MTEISRIVRVACAAVAMAFATALPAAARHDEIQDDPAVVAERLHHMGFVEWRKLRWDDGKWKIDDARRENGHLYDLELEAGSFDIIRLKRERG